MDEIKKPKKSKKHIIDVQEPGTTAPSPTSRPVIVGNRPLLRDPMVVEPADEDEPKAADEQPEALLASSQKAAIQPLESADGQADDTSPEEPVPQADEAAGKTPADKADAPGSLAEPPVPAALNQADQPEPASDPVPDDTGKQPADGTAKQPVAKQAEAEAVAQAKHDAETQQLIDSKQYLLPIHTTEQRKSKRFVVLGAVLAVILVIVWLDVALDADIIKLGGLKPLTHFFSN